MEIYFFIIISIVIGLVLGFIIGKLLTQSNLDKVFSDLSIDNQKLSHSLSLKNESTEQLQRALEESQIQVKEQINRWHKEKEELVFKGNLLEQDLRISLTKKNDFIEKLEEKILLKEEEFEKMKDKFEKEFELLANKILEEKTTKFTEQNKVNLKAILDPLQEKINHFEKKIEDTNKESIQRNSQLREQIFNLKNLNEQMSKEALNLTKALKGDNKMQGNWGELVLERVLEKSGLEKGREYEVQQSFTNEETGKRLMPDVVIYLPDNKKMIIDSKVSLTAYERYVNEEDQELRNNHLKHHLLSLNHHVEQLSAKRYEDIYEIESPDFVLLFVPIEPAFALAINKDTELYNKAFGKNIIIVTPSTLLATLRTIDSMWNNEKQQRNAMEIARQAGGLYDKFEGLVTDLTRVGKKMDDTKKEYSSAMNKLVEGRGNLVTSVEKLKKMGAKAKKSLPQQLIERAKDED